MHSPPAANSLLQCGRDTRTLSFVRLTSSFASTTVFQSTSLFYGVVFLFFCLATPNRRWATLGHGCANWKDTGQDRSCPFVPALCFRPAGSLQNRMVELKLDLGIIESRLISRWNLQSPTTDSDLAGLAVSTLPTFYAPNFQAKGQPSSLLPSFQLITRGVGPSLDSRGTAIDVHRPNRDSQRSLSSVSVLTGFCSIVIVEPNTLVKVMLRT
ncbi:hypothetical protein DFH09DRAFT_1160852 [Mycena vulgaris]|nr:hypothetical protein DFH09DRAFT_1160852 [Mycena vulgaris]